MLDKYSKHYNEIIYFTNLEEIHRMKENVFWVKSIIPICWLIYKLNILTILFYKSPDFINKWLYY